MARKLDVAGEHGRHGIDQRSDRRDDAVPQQRRQQRPVEAARWRCEVLGGNRSVDRTHAGHLPA